MTKYTCKIKVDSNVPVPAKTQELRFPFLMMKVGDSFKFDREIYRHVSAHSAFIKKKNGWDFMIRTVNGKPRIWRVK